MRLGVVADGLRLIRLTWNWLWIASSSPLVPVYSSNKLSISTARLPSSISLIFFFLLLCSRGGFIDDCTRFSSSAAASTTATSPPPPPAPAASPMGIGADKPPDDGCNSRSIIVESASSGIEVKNCKMIWMTRVLTRRFLAFGFERFQVGVC